mmetsp:Transcript_59999/g.105022  ORF Transcript_59999/g.105022 Transcript_59999/m.105022 type:complete len:262 (+) Transcript_59999:1582-2367(+)
MGDDTVTICFLNSMGNSVTILENHTTGLLMCIEKKNGHLSLDAQTNQLQEGCVAHHKLAATPTVLGIHAIFGESFHETLCMLASQERRVLGKLAKSRKQLLSWQGPAESHINKDLQWCIKRPNVVLAAVVTNGCFQGCHYIVHCQQRGGNIDQLRAAIQDGSKKACHIEQSTTAKSNHYRLLRSATVEGPPHEGREVVPRLACVTLWQHMLHNFWHVLWIVSSARLSGGGANAALQWLEVAGMMVPSTLVAEKHDLVRLDL